MNSWFPASIHLSYKHLLSSILTRPATVVGTEKMCHILCVLSSTVSPQSAFINVSQNRAQTELPVQDLHGNGLQYHSHQSCRQISVAFLLKKWRADIYWPLNTYILIFSCLSLTCITQKMFKLLFWVPHEIYTCLHWSVYWEFDFWSRVRKIIEPQKEEKNVVGSRGETATILCLVGLGAIELCSELNPTFMLSDHSWLGLEDHMQIKPR